MKSGKYSDFRLYQRLLLQARPYWPHITGIFVLNLLLTPLTLLTPLPLKIVVDSAIGSQPLPAFLDILTPDTFALSATSVLLLAIGLMVIITLMFYLRGFGSSLLETYTGERLVLSFRAELFRYMQRLSLSYHDKKGTSDSVYRIQYDAPSIQWIAVQGIIPLITAVFSLMGMIYVTALIDLQLAAVALTISPVLFLITQIFLKRIRSEWSAVKEVETRAFSVVQEVLSALRIVKAFGQEDREEGRFLHHSNDSVQGKIRLSFIKGEFDILIGLTIAIGTAAVLFIGVRHVQEGVLTLGNFLIVMAYLAQLYVPLQTMSSKMADLQASLASAERALMLFDEAQDVFEKSDARTLPRASGNFELKEVSFAYPDGPPVLSNISYNVTKGSRVGIVGATGTGKTTLISLLTRFYDPTKGRILLDGIDLRDYKLRDLRNQFSIVLQEPILLSTTIAENIAYARLKASKEEIVEAAILANAHDFISHLPYGYQTQVGERGMTLSGGERQRIALARAFLKNAPILILDEPTSSIDIKTETVIMDAIERLMRNRTTFIITHRLNTLRNCDILLIIENGQLVTVSFDVSSTIKELLVSKKNNLDTYKSEKGGKIYDPSG
jgi:ATP-binding cassette subfamily B protein